MHIYAFLIYMYVSTVFCFSYFLYLCPWVFQAWQLYTLFLVLELPSLGHMQ